MIVGLHGTQGLGKTHLIDAFENAIKGVAGVRPHRPHPKYGFSQHQREYQAANVIISDDLFQEHSDLTEVFEKGNFRGATHVANSLPEFLFDLYDGKKIWVVSSNFDIKEILRRVAEMDGQDRLKSRIKHLLATTGTLHLEGEDHRGVLAKTGTRFSSLFS